MLRHRLEIQLHLKLKHREQVLHISGRQAAVMAQNGATQVLQETRQQHCHLQHLLTTMEDYIDV